MQRGGASTQKDDGGLVAHMSRASQGSVLNYPLVKKRCQATK